MLISYIAGHLGKADQFPVRVEEPIDVDASPEAGAVLADAPTLSFVFALLSGDLEGSHRNAFFAVFRCVKTREMLANDLFLGISFDPFRAQIPVGHMRLRINHVDRVIDDTLNKQLKLLFSELVRLIHELNPLRSYYAFPGMQVSSDML